MIIGMQKRCPGPVAIVTGAGRRIGRSIALRLFNDGFSVFLHYRQSKWESERLREKLNSKRAHSAIAYHEDFAYVEDRQLSPPGIGLSCSASSLPPLEQRCERLLEACISHYGRCDVLVNCASAFFPSPLFSKNKNDSVKADVERSTTDSTVGNNQPHWEDVAGLVFGSNALAPFYLTKAFVGFSGNRCSTDAEQKCIVNIIDSMLDRPLDGFTLYTMAKRALEGLTTSSALELARYNIRVNAVSPGLSLFPEQSSVTNVLKESAAVRKTVPLGQMEASGETIAEMVGYLVSPAASYITGAIIPVDGGWRLSRKTE